MTSHPNKVAIDELRAVERGLKVTLRDHAIPHTDTVTASAVRIDLDNVRGRIAALQAAEPAVPAVDAEIAAQFERFQAAVVEMVERRSVADGDDEFARVETLRAGLLLRIAHRVAEAEARGRREALTEFQDWFLDGAIETVCGGESMMHASHSFDDECKKLRGMLARAAGGGT